MYLFEEADLMSDALVSIELLWGFLNIEEIVHLMLLWIVLWFVLLCDFTFIEVLFPYQ